MDEDTWGKLFEDIVLELRDRIAFLRQKGGYRNEGRLAEAEKWLERIESLLEERSQ